MDSLSNPRGGGLVAEFTVKPLFTWRSAIADKSSGLTPTQRHVALTVSLHMSERGDSCFPATRTIADETGLSRSTVMAALKALQEKKWLKKGRRGGGRGWVNEYRAVIPETVRLSDPSGNGPTDDSESSETAQSAPLNGPLIGPEDVKPLGRKTEDVRHPTFELFWTVYPKRVGRTEAERAWEKTVKRGTEPNTIIEGAQRYAAWCVVALESGRLEGTQFVKHPGPWLNAGRWDDELDDPTIGPRSNGHQTFGQAWGDLERRMTGGTGRVEDDRRPVVRGLPAHEDVG